MKERKGEIASEPTWDEREKRREGERREEDSVVAFIRNPSVSLGATLVYRIRAVVGTRRTEKTTGKERGKEKESEKSSVTEREGEGVEERGCRDRSRGRQRSFEKHP